MTGTWAHMTAAELGREIGKGRIHPGEAMAAAARAKAGLRKGLLDGVPISWKDLFDTAGVATEAGSALLKGRSPDRDAEVLETATLQGLVCLGKTHMSELAFSGLGLNPVTATPPNLNDDRAVPGGSSSGAAASVAFGLAPAAIGSDSGGSVRIPAAWNDLVGLKTTMGSLPLTGVVPLFDSFDTIGPLAHSVEDCGLLLAALQGREPADLVGGTMSGLRLGLLESLALDDIRDRPAQAFEDATQRLSKAGARIERFAFPEVAEAVALAGILCTAEAYGTWRVNIEAAPDKVFSRILERFRSGAKIAAADYVAGWRRLRDIRAQWAERTTVFDAVILPTSPILPPDANRLMTDDAYYVTENLLALRNTRIGNMLGLCALTLRTSQPSCGITLMAGPDQDIRLLRIGSAAERALR
ncbi:MAG: aspartyl-tRNA(Asn)/glutamyl-tRNA (Gln) amidotransferase subunit A [Rhodobacteraceae bacterium]|nr:MAG: aspartyl-tRNA(Asn)/glutamyl-tRNA (Gln) amidotransferase subunit A [Paracoccaceae bacterium]